MCISGSMLHVYVILYASTCTFLVHTYIHTDIHIYTQTYIHTYKHMYTQTDIHIYFLQVRKHTHGHTHKHTHTLSLSHSSHTHMHSLAHHIHSVTYMYTGTHPHTHTCQETEGLGCIPNGTPTTVHVYCHRRHLHPGITANVRRRSSGLSMPPCLHTN